jgi:phospholipid transport system substrate-binding protein
MRGRFERGLAAMFAAIVLLISPATPAFAGADAERFAKDLIDRGFAILRDDSVDDATRSERFHAFILPNIDARKTALFTLGNYRRGASEAEVDTFVAAFAEYSTAMYETRLTTYKNATLTVIGSIENKPGDVTVNTLGNEASLREPIRVAFRLVGSNGEFKIVDIQVVGIWLSVEQRDQFASILGQNNGKVSALTSILVERTKQMRAS